MKCINTNNDKAGNGYGKLHRVKLLRHFLPIILIFQVLMFIGSSQARAQQNPMISMNNELRSLFSNLNNPNAPIHFLYDMSAHLVDSTFFTKISTDTSNVDNWFNIYREMYYSAYDTTQYINSAQVFQQIFPIVQHDTIPIGIIEYDYNLLKNDALTTGNYFVFDTVNSLLYDKNPQPISPYSVHSVFAASPLVQQYPNANVVFKVSPEFMFVDNLALYNPDFRTLKIDFGDGNGWITFNGQTTTNHEVTYPTSGRKVVKTALFDRSGMIALSTSIIDILTGTVTVPPTDIITDIPGIDVGIYENCEENVSKKYVIYLEGMDFLNNRSIPDIYSHMIQNKHLAQLRNFGYTFVVVSWHDPYADMEDNAMGIVRLIEELKCKQTDQQAQPFVVIGESMGGLIGRYALTYMESPQYDIDKSPWMCNKRLRHNTRLFITFDSPHQGANIPLGVQQLYRHLLPFTYLFSSYTIGLGQQFATLLDGKASKQMLLYHVETDLAPGAPISASPYGPSPYKVQFDQDLKNLGNYPRLCKLVALSNGALDGSRQKRQWDHNPRQPNDHMLLFDQETYLRVLGIKIIGTNSHMDVRTNPAGSGSVFKMQMGLSHWKIKLHWFGVKLVWGSTDLFNIDKTALNVRPYCVSAASNLDIDNPFTDTVSFSTPDWTLALGFRADYNVDGQGNLNFSTSGGIPWLANANLNFHAYSDGFDFGFIPIHSSFDYQASNPDDLDYDIYKNETVADIMGKTPFDVVYTNPTELGNRYHMTVDNPPLGLYKSCSGMEGITSYLLNREIGDDSLWLENTRTFPNEYFEAEQKLMVNYRNIYYNYPSTSSLLYYYSHSARYHFVVSKQNPVTNVGGAISLSANTPVLINPAAPLNGSYQILAGNMQVCCEDYLERPAAGAEFSLQPKASSSEMTLYPNPVEGNIVTLAYHFKDNGPVGADIYSSQGVLLQSIKMPFVDNTQQSYYTLDFSKFRFPSGVYLIRLNNGKESLTQKLVITH